MYVKTGVYGLVSSLSVRTKGKSRFLGSVWGPSGWPWVVLRIGGWKALEHSWISIHRFLDETRSKIWNLRVRDIYSNSLAFYNKSLLGPQEEGECFNLTLPVRLARRLMCLGSFSYLLIITQTSSKQWRWMLVTYRRVTMFYLWLKN